MQDWSSEVSKYLAGGGATLVLSAAARALPLPQAGGSVIYGFFYRFVQNLLANFDKAEAGRNQMLAKPR